MYARGRKETPANRRIVADKAAEDRAMTEEEWSQLLKKRAELIAKKNRYGLDAEDKEELEWFELLVDENWSDQCHT